MKALQEFLDRSGIQQSELARRANVPPQRICDVLKGRLARFSPTLAKRISEATGGALSLEVLLGLEERVSTKRVRAKRRAGSVSTGGSKKQAAPVRLWPTGQQEVPSYAEAKTGAPAKRRRTGGAR